MMVTWTTFDTAADAATATTVSQQQALTQLELRKDKPAHINFDGSVKIAPLAHYITTASKQCLLRPASDQIFRHAPNVTLPTLRDNQENRVLVFPGAFNPPHLGHTGLLWHVYLSLSSSTIAAIILPMKSSSVTKKKLTKASNRKDRRTFALSSHQRRQLWQDEVLGRFVWVWPEDHCDQSSQFLRCVQRLASEDGFQVDFPSLHGGDHMRSFQRDGRTGWGLGSVVTSDVGRAVDFVKGRYDEVSLPHCEEWKEQKTRSCGSANGEDTNCCCACQKLRAVYPEFFHCDPASSK